MLTRDSVSLMLTIIVASLGVVVAQFDLLPPSWQAYRGIITVAFGAIGAAASILSRSPLAGDKTPQSESRRALMGLVKLHDKE